VTGVVTESPAVAQPAPARWRPSLAVVIAALAALAMVAGWLVFFSPVVAARSVVVRGSFQRLSAAEIRSAADVSTHTPLVRLDTGAIKRRVAAIAGVAAVSVSRSFPSTVTIRVTERIPVGYLNQGSGFALVDKTGVQFGTVTATPPGLPRFELAPGADARPSTVAAAEVAGVLPGKILSSLASVSAGSATAVSLVLRDGRVVRWGAPVRNAEKAQLLVALLKQPGSTFDISDPDIAVIR